MNMKGSLPLLILQRVSNGPLHGYQIAMEIKQVSKGVLDFKEGTLYPALHGLEQQGLLTAYQQEENGRIRRYYRLTDKGHATLAQEKMEWQQYASAVNLVLGVTA
jgi:PadR family transcriptional regulator, regulatory protein PadR